MNNFKIENKYINNYKELTNANDYIKAYSKDSIQLDEYVYNTSKLVLDTRQLFVSSKYNTINDIAVYYNTNIYYFAGKYETQRICMCTIIPAEVETLTKNFKALLIIDDLNNKINITIYPNISFDYILYDNPKDAGKEYIEKNLIKYHKIYNDTKDILDNTKFEDIENKIKEKYRVLYQEELSKEKQKFEEDTEKNKFTLEFASKMITKYEELSKKINII